MEFVYDLCLSKDAELSLSGQQDYVTKIGTWFGSEDSVEHGINIATYDDDGNLVGGVVDFNGHEIRNAEITNTTIKLPSPNQIIVQTTTILGEDVEYPVVVQPYASTLATMSDLGYTKDPIEAGGNGNYYGYYGSLKNLGVNGAYVDIKSISFSRRTDAHPSTDNENTYLKARLMRLINNVWKIHSESKQWFKPNDFTELGASVGEFTMEKVAGAGPLSTTEKIAIVFVTYSAQSEVATPNSLGLSVGGTNSSAAGMGVAGGNAWITGGYPPKTLARNLPRFTIRYTVDQVYEQLTNEEISRITTLQNVFDNSLRLSGNNKISATINAPGSTSSIEINSANPSSIFIGDSTSGARTNATEFFSVISASNANDIIVNANEGLSLGVGLKGFVSGGTLPNTIQPNSFGIFASGTNGSASIMSGSTLAGSSVVAYTQFGSGNITSYAPNVMTIQGNAMLMASSDNLLLTGNQNIVMTSNGYNNNVNGSMSIDVGQNTTLTSNKFENVVSEFKVEINDSHMPSLGSELRSNNNGFILNNSAFYLGSRRDPECSCLSLHVLGNAFIAGANDKLPDVINSFNGTAWGFDTDLRLYGKNKVLIGRSEVLVPNVGADDIGGQYLSNYEQSGFSDSAGNPDPTHYSRAISSDTLCQFMTTRMSGQGISYDSTAKNYFVPTISDSTLGIAKIGGKGITKNDNSALVIDHRSSYSGFEFENDRKIYVNVADQSSHPENNSTPAVLFDKTGKLAVSDQAGRAMSTVNNASPSDDNSNVYGWIGKLSQLGVYSGLINSVVFYRRANATPNADTRVFLRLLKRVNNAWVIASQSTNSVSFGAQTINADPVEKFFMKPVNGVEPPSPDETIALVCVSSATAEVTSSIKFGTKTINGAAFKGAIQTEFSNFSGASTESYYDYAPKMTIVWTPYAKDQTQKIQSIESSLQTLQNIVANMQTSANGAFISLQYNVPANQQTTINLPFSEAVEIYDKDGDFINASEDGTITVDPIS